MTRCSTSAAEPTDSRCRIVSANSASGGCSRTCLEDPVLGKELDVRDAAAILLQVELPLPRLPVLGTHSLAHRDDLLAQGLALDRLDEHRAADSREGGAETGIARNPARMQERLVLPGPGFAPLVLLERADLGECEATLAGRPQPHIHFVEPASSGMHSQQVHEPLSESQEEDLIVHHLRAARLLPLACGVVKKDEIEVRGVAKLHAAELAVAGDPEPHGALLSFVLAARLAVLRGRVPECQRERLIDDQLGHVRQPVADPHQRQPAGEIQHRDPKHRRPPELAERVHAKFLVASRMLQPGRELLRKLPAVRKGLEHARVEQLVEQERMRGDLAGEIVAHAADLHEPAERLGVFVK